MFADLCGVNSPMVADFKLSTWRHTTWIWEEIHRVSSSKLEYATLAPRFTNQFWEDTYEAVNVHFPFCAWTKKDSLRSGFFII